MNKPKMKNVLNQYVGRLSPAKVAEGINSAAANARRLYEDAKLLLENKRFPSAAALSILAIEEAGKASILRELSLARNQQEISNSWRDYRSHTKKNQMLPFGAMICDGARKLEDFRPLFENSENPRLFENLKQISLYTDCLNDAHWSSPNDVADEGLARCIVLMAELLVCHSKMDVTEKEIEIWIKNVGPFWKQDDKLMKEAIRKYFVEMHDFGLLDLPLEEALAFINDKEWVH